MQYRHFLFDLDDTLLDFRASERLSFQRTLSEMGIDLPLAPLHAIYQRENAKLWRLLEQGGIDKETLKTERFRLTFAEAGIDADATAAAHHYLQFLPETVVLIEGAEALCKLLSSIGEIGIITNGIESVQSRRIARSGLADMLSFVATSEACGHAKPDVRFFEYSASRFKGFNKAQALIVGDRLEADILGGNRYGIHSCWFNRYDEANSSEAVPTYTVKHLAEVAAL